MNALASKHKLVKAYMLDFGYIEIYSNFAIGSMNDGIDLSLENISTLSSLAEIHYGNKSFGYISLRKNSYAIDPALYTYIKELPNLTSVAIVSDKDIFKHNYKIEKYFYGKEMKLFKNIESAINWIDGNSG